MAFNIRWIGQGGFVITMGDKKICIDPYLSNSVLNLDGFDRLLPIPTEPKDLKVDMVISTHDHMDHLDEETIRDMDWNSIIFAGPSSCAKHFKTMGIGDDRVVTINMGKSVYIGHSVVTAVYANHTEDPNNFKEALEDSNIKYYELSFNKEYDVKKILS